MGSKKLKSLKLIQSKESAPSFEGFTPEESDLGKGKLDWFKQREVGNIARPMDKDEASEEREKQVELINSQYKIVGPRHNYSLRNRHK